MNLHDQLRAMTIEQLDDGIRRLDRAIRKAHDWAPFSMVRDEYVAEHARRTNAQIKAALGPGATDEDVGLAIADVFAAGFLAQKP